LRIFCLMCFLLSWQSLATPVANIAAKTTAAKTVLFLTLEYPPYASEQLPGRGAALELLQLMLAGSGFKPVVQFVPWSRVLREAAAGRVDGALLLWPEEFKRYPLLSTSPLFLSRLGFYVRQTELATRDVRLAALANQRVCTVRGYGYPPALSAAGVLLDEAMSDEANLRRMMLGRCDLVALERAVGEHLLQQSEFAALRRQISWAEPAFVELPLTFGVTAGRADSAALLLALEQGLARLRQQQQYQQLLQRYGLDQP